MKIYTYNNYSVEITYESEFNFYEGKGKDTGCYFMDESEEKIEERFREYIESIVEVLEYQGIKLFVYNSYLEEEGQLIGEFARRMVEVPAFFGKDIESIKKQFEEYIDELETNYNLYLKLTGKE